MIDWVAVQYSQIYANVQLLFDRVFITIVYTTQKHIMILFPFIGWDINHIIGENYAKQRLHKFPKTQTTIWRCNISEWHMVLNDWQFHCIGLVGTFAYAWNNEMWFIEWGLFGWERRGLMWFESIAERWDARFAFYYSYGNLNMNGLFICDGWQCKCIHVIMYPMVNYLS